MYLTPLYERPGPEYIVDLAWLEQFCNPQLEKKYIYWLDGCPRVSGWMFCGTPTDGPFLANYIARYMKLVALDQLSFCAVNGLQQLCSLSYLKDEPELQNIIPRITAAIKSRKII